MSLKNTLLLFHILFIISTLPAQSPDHVWLDNGTIRVRINADGRLFCDDEKGAFLVPHGDSMVSIMRGAGLWFGGFDPGGSLYLAIQTPDPEMSDFFPGLIDVPNSGKIWKVTREEIIAHIEDYQDNFQIDNPIPSIFAWPGRGNKFFETFNGFKQDNYIKAPHIESPFHQFNQLPYTFEYKPDWGDIPQYKWHQQLNEYIIPREMAFFTCFSNRSSSVHQLKSLPIQMWGYASVYDCDMSHMVSNTVFVSWYWKFQDTATIWYDSVAVAAYTDFDLGDPSDDYHGCRPEGNTYFVYNADTVDAVLGSNPPLGYVGILAYPFDRHYIDPHDGRTFGLMPIGCQEVCENADVLFGMRYPEAISERYNYLTNSWKDGTPLSGYGSGYNPGNPDAFRVPAAFPDYPENFGEWSELSAGNLKNNRLALLNFYIKRPTPGSIYSMTFAYSFLPRKKNTLKEDIMEFENQMELFQKDDIIDGPPKPPHPFKQLGCNPPPDGPRYHVPDTLSVFPNPVSDILRVWHGNQMLQKLVLYDQLGIKVATGVNHNTHSEIPVEHLPAGLYWLVVETTAGEKKQSKVVIAH